MVIILFQHYIKSATLSDGMQNSNTCTKIIRIIYTCIYIQKQ